MSDDDVRAAAREVLALDAEATPGPWVPAEWHGADDGGWAAIGPHHDATDEDSDEPGCAAHARAEADARFIARLRTLAPVLARAVLDAPAPTERAPAPGNAAREAAPIATGTGGEIVPYPLAEGWAVFSHATSEDGATLRAFVPGADRAFADEMARALVSDGGDTDPLVFDPDVEPALLIDGVLWTSNDVRVNTHAELRAALAGGEDPNA